MEITREELLRRLYHEAGHAVVGVVCFYDYAPSPRRPEQYGRVLGSTHLSWLRRDLCKVCFMIDPNDYIMPGQLPDDERQLRLRQHCMMYMAGYLAVEIEGGIGGNDGGQEDRIEIKTVLEGFLLPKAEQQTRAALNKELEAHTRQILDSQWGAVKAAVALFDAEIQKSKDKQAEIPGANVEAVIRAALVD